MLKFKNPSIEETATREWIVTNGIGGYASSTVAGTNTRRYHGLLVASLNPPTQRQVMVSKIEECIGIQRDTCIEFSTNRYPNVVHPQGFQYLQTFERDPLVKMVFHVGNQWVAKTVFMVYGSNTTVVEYENIGADPYQLSLTPLLVDRNYHSLFQQNESFDFYYEQEFKSLKIFSRYGSLPLYVKFSKGEFEENRFWFRNFEYEKEKDRGLDYLEDSYAVGKISFILEPGEKTYITFSIDPEILSNDPKLLKEMEIKRLNKLLQRKSENNFLNDLLIASNQFIVKRASTDSYSILAGYHWFTDWGRDTMIAMRGLCIATGRKKVSRSILKTFLSHLDRGMLPNRFPDFTTEKIAYNTIDATLWLFIAIYEYYLRFRDKEFIFTHFGKLTEVIEWHIKGTRYDIGVNEEGFLCGGSGQDQLTWMDARLDNYVVTPRHGCPVEIQALWYNALKIYQFLAREAQMEIEPDLLQNCTQICLNLEVNFPSYFLNEKGYLNDVVVPDGPADDSIRPNQIYALSLPFSILNRTQEERIFETVRAELYTPYGLRTLSRQHPDFKSVYRGTPWDRDLAYHQGTVWPFLLEPYYQAQFKIYGHSEQMREEVLKSIKVLEDHFYNEGCIHGISEIFDGLEPTAGRGTIHQAWSVAALLKILIDEGLFTLQKKSSQPNLESTY